MTAAKKLLIAAALVYFPVSAALAGNDWIVGARQNRKCRCIERGQQRFQKSDVKKCELYSPEQIRKTPSLAEVELYYLPGNGGEKRPYVICIPGGAYLECRPDYVALPGAAEYNALGYSAFVLKYRIRRHTDDYAPIDDLAAAVAYITEHAEELNVEADNYMLTGFSAGGNLAGLFASKELGYAKYGLAKPSALTLLYPWTNISAHILPSGNIFKDAYNLLGKTLAIRVLLGDHSSRAAKETICVHNQVNADFPPCLIIHGEKDFLVPKEKNSDILVEKLRKCGVPCEYIVCTGLTHGFGLGVGTPAEGWCEKSVKFREQYCPSFK